MDGFAGGGRYKCGTAGSLIIFIEVLEKAQNFINIRRTEQGLGTIEIECLLIFNDADPDVIELLKSNCAPVIAAAKTGSPNLHLRTVFMTELFEQAYPEIKIIIEKGRYRSVLFNLDQCGVSQVNVITLLDIMHMSSSVEIFYTFMIKSLLTYLNKSDPAKLGAQLKALNISSTEQSKLHGGQSNDAWMGAAERLVFENFHTCARFVSPFSINNPGGWRYWLIHFSNSYRARQAYNMILHKNASTQAHCGRSGLHMLSYDPSHEGTAYLFDISGRAQAKQELLTDIPRLVTEHGDAINVSDFYEGIYNLTPAHRDDIHAAIIENPDLEVLTDGGGERRKPNTITAADTIKLKNQTSFFPLFLGNSETK